MRRGNAERNTRRRGRTVSLVAGAVVTSLLTSAPPTAADGVPERCTKCHAENVIVERTAKMPAGERLKRLDTFLVKHFAPDPTERKAIAAALAAKAEKR